MSALKIFSVLRGVGLLGMLISAMASDNGGDFATVMVCGVCFTAIALVGALGKEGYKRKRQSAIPCKTAKVYYKDYSQRMAS